MVAVGARHGWLDTRDHVASAGSRQRAPPAGAFIRSEVLSVSQAVLFSPPHALSFER